MPDALVLDGRPLAIDDVVSVARAGRGVALAPAALERVTAGHAAVARVAADSEATYGVNTGFGSLARVRVELEELTDLQHNLVRSHAAGLGDPLDVATSRAMMTILAASLARGASGVRPEVIRLLLDLLDRGVTPSIPARGSVGASGDLAPLAHLALVLIGEGEATVDGKTLPGAAALAEAGLTPIALDVKEGLALINGTHLMAAIGALALADTERLADAAVTATALSIDACRATDSFLDSRLHELRRHPGQASVAERLRTLLQGSEIIEAHREDDPRVQDPYCLRAAPPVLGAALDAIANVRSVVERELGAVTDNPLVFEDGAVVSGANFHGMPLAIALDTLKIALCHVAGIAERRTFWVLAARDPENPVQPYLSPKPGTHSGYMIAQYTAAACCNEMQVLATPASVGNIPTSAGIEDYNSYGATSALHARSSVERATEVVAIELLVMAEALEYQRPLRSGAGVERAVSSIRDVVPRLDHDRSPRPDILQVIDLIRGGRIA